MPFGFLGDPTLHSPVLGSDLLSAGIPPGAQKRRTFPKVEAWVKGPQWQGAGSCLGQKKQCPEVFRGKAEEHAAMVSRDKFKIPRSFRE